jgi:general secretion pathway protein C
MQDLIKRYFWVLGGVVVVVCAVFAAKATGHVLEAKFLGDAEHGPKITPVIGRVDTPTTAVRTKEGASIATRNMFCSDCTPPVAVAQINGNDPGGGVPVTTLPVALLATNIGLRDSESYATIVNTENQKQGAYSIGDPVPGATSSGKIKEIHFKYVDFENNNRTERIMLVGVTPPTAVAAAEPAPNPNPPAEGDELQASIDTGIKKIDDSHYEVDKALIEKVLLNPMAFAKGARVVPSMKNGKPDGFKLYAIRPNSAFAKLGLSNGDTLQSINGFELTSADKALEVYTKLREATSLEVDVTRRGKPMSLNYSIK